MSASQGEDEGWQRILYLEPDAHDLNPKSLSNSVYILWVSLSLQKNGNIDTSVVGVLGPLASHRPQTYPVGPPPALGLGATLCGSTHSHPAACCMSPNPYI